MTGRSGSRGTFRILLPDPPGQRLWLNIKVQGHSKTRRKKEKKNQDHSKAHELPKSSNDTNVVWPRGKTQRLQQKSQKQRKIASEAGIWVGPGQAAEEPATESQGPCIVTYSPPQHHGSPHPVTLSHPDWNLPSIPATCPGYMA